MKRNWQKLACLVLMLTFSVAAVMCCCLPKTLEAKEEQMSCHQSSESHEPTQETDECSCDDTLAILTEKVDSKIDLLSKAMLVSNAPLSDSILQISFKTADHPPPIIIDTSPLYIKNSILRI